MPRAGSSSAISDGSYDSPGGVWQPEVETSLDAIWRTQLGNLLHLTWRVFTLHAAVTTLQMGVILKDPERRMSDEQLSFGSTRAVVGRTGRGREWVVAGIFRTGRPGRQQSSIAAASLRTRRAGSSEMAAPQTECSAPRFR